MRREELRFSGKFERLELPLAVAALLVFTLLAVQLIVVNKQIAWRDEGDPARGLPGDMQIWLMASNAHMLPNPDTEPPYPGRLTNPPEELVRACERFEKGQEQNRTKFQQLQWIRGYLKEEIRKLQTDLKYVSDIKQPQSALEATTLVMDLIDKQGDDVGRFGVRGLQADYAFGKGGRGDHVIVKLDMDFFAESDLQATRHYNNMVNALEAEPWCLEFERKPTKVLDGGDGIYVDGITILVDVTEGRPTPVVETDGAEDKA